ncbi:MAG: hypothetical protein P1P69_03205 [Methanosarcinaceae archaeon]|nr:hypothetical protein [Methanosarcinaceae archaeon]MDF1533494.1 hypothetical protein [Methanosarcinaceae archaeon]
MKKYILSFFIILLIAGASSGCLDKITKESSVLHLDLSVAGDYQNPVIDVTNTDRYLENVPFLKQKRYDIVTQRPYIHAVMFYNRDKISYYTSVPYTGPGNYLFTITFEDGKVLPTSSNESIVANVQFVDANGIIIGDEYFSVRWP